MALSIDQEVFVVNRELDDYGKRGKVVKLDLDARCGNLENDPLVTVLLDDGSSDGFWTEELSLTSPALPPRFRLHVHSVEYINDGN